MELAGTYIRRPKHDQPDNENDGSTIKRTHEGIAGPSLGALYRQAPSLRQRLKSQRPTQRLRLKGFVSRESLRVS